MTCSAYRARGWGREGEKERATCSQNATTYLSKSNSSNNSRNNNCRAARRTALTRMTLCAARFVLSRAATGTGPSSSFLFCSSSQVLCFAAAAAVVFPLLFCIYLACAFLHSQRGQTEHTQTNPYVNNLTYAHTPTHTHIAREDNVWQVQAALSQKQQQQQPWKNKEK